MCSATSTSPRSSPVEVESGEGCEAAHLQPLDLGLEPKAEAAAGILPRESTAHAHTERRWPSLNGVDVLGSWHVGPGQMCAVREWTPRQTDGLASATSPLLECVLESVFGIGLGHGDQLQSCGACVGGR